MCGPSGGRIVRRPGVRSAPADGCLPRRQLDAVGSRRRSDSEHAEQRRPHRTVRRSRVDAEQAVEWLADESALTLLGDEAESTWLAWVQSDACADTFDAQGFGDAEPDPDLLVAAAIGLDTPRYSRTWSDGPRDRDVLRALDETRVDIENRTPQRGTSG